MSEAQMCCGQIADKAKLLREFKQLKDKLSKAEQDLNLLKNNLKEAEQDLNDAYLMIEVIESENERLKGLL